MCQWSRYRAHFYRYESPYRDETKFIVSLNSIVSRCSPRLLLPSHDETEIIARHRDAFPSTVAIPISSASQLALANDKYRAQVFADQAGVPAPRMLDYKDLKHLSALLAESGSGHRWVVKLRKSNSAKGVFYPSNTASVVAVVEQVIKQFNLPNDRLPLVQEYVEGEGWGVSCLYWEGQRIASFTHRRLREKTRTGGTSTLREHQPNPLVEEMAHKLLGALGWHGLAMVEFKYDPSTKRAWFIEINPRLWGSLHLAIAAGVEFPYLVYLAATGTASAAADYQAKKTVQYPYRARWYLGDCIRAAGSVARGKLLDAARLILPGGADTYDDVDCRDPGAFAGEVVHYGIEFLRSGNMNPAEDGTLG
ncbi:MAG TPA: ATP-grasp domain-containing protein [Chitinivibrionales bacterium]|nr:ATP-grasp domain-containing protein [Chitinivibrionales bacterium]